jgi:hypothetical protein
MSLSRVLAIVLALSAATAVHAQDSGKAFVRTGRHGEQIITYIPPKPPPRLPQTFVLKAERGGPRLAGRLIETGATLEEAGHAPFVWDGDVLVHRITGVRLPKVHDGCRLAALARFTPPDATQPLPYERGARAEYDCQAAAPDLGYVDVVFEADSAFLKEKSAPQGLQVGAANVASKLVRAEVHVDGTPCTMMDLKTEPGHVNRDLAAAQCGVKWATVDHPTPLFGSAAYVLARGDSYVGFQNSCIDPVCATNRPKFGHFLDTFDLTSLKAGPTS